jgi:hypothetical protein
LLALYAVAIGTLFCEECRNEVLSGHWAAKKNEFLLATTWATVMMPVGLAESR